MNLNILLVKSLVDLTPVHPNLGGMVMALPSPLDLSLIDRKNNLQLDIANLSSLNTNQKVTT